VNRKVASIALVMIVGALIALPPGAAAESAGSSPLTCDGRWHVVHSVSHSRQAGEIDQLNAVSALAPSDGWAVGFWEKYPEAYNFHTLAEHFDGTAWKRVKSPNSPAQNQNYLNGVAALSTDDVWAVGATGLDPYGTLVEHWDGVSWSIVPAATYEGLLFAVAALGPDDIWAVGTENYSTARGLIEHWDGNSWTATYLPFAAVLRGVTALGPEDIWAVGYRYNPADPEGDFTLTEHFDGTGWTRVRSPSPLKLHSSDQNWLTSVTAVASNDVWAVGLTRDLDWGIQDRTLTEHWGGTKWTRVRSRNPTGDWFKNDLWGVAAVGSDDVWAVGSHGIDPTSDPPLAEHWDGTRWRVVGVPSKGQLLAIAAEPAGTGLSAVGDHYTSTYVGTLAEHLCPG
jgi:hypothetical protein